MHEVVGIRFKPCSKIYDFEVNGVSVKLGMWVVVDSEMGLSLGLVVKERHTIEKSEQKFKKILRIATVEDLEGDRNNRRFEDKAKEFCIERVKNHNLPMKVVGTEATLDRKRLVFYFAAEGRIDFRELVRDLASQFKTRIEMRQIGVRDEVKFVGGIGCCGREVCCRIFLTSFEPISIRMAKKQELILNPGKLSGICGRLMCCLGYEIEQPVHKKIKDNARGQEIKDKIITAEKESTAETVVYDNYNARPPEEVKPVEEKRQTTRYPSNTKKAKIKKEQKIPKLSKSKDRGKPFNKRKKFWKKKKKR